MVLRRPTDGYECTKCKRVYFPRYGIPLCPWCYRESLQPKDIRPEVRRKLSALSRRLERIVGRDGWDCWLCGEKVDPYELGIHRASADHVKPKSHGGSNALTNLKLAHQSCNGYRHGGGKPFAPFEREYTSPTQRKKMSTPAAEMPF